MESQKSYVPIKLFLGYAVLATLVVAVTFMLFSENATFSKIERNISDDNNRLLRINSFIAEVHKTESMARLTIQSGEQTDYDDYTNQTIALFSELDTLKSSINAVYQKQLIDSVGLLVSLKKSNIDQLREIKSKVGNEAKVTEAINELTRMEESLRKLRLSDFAAEPSKLEPHQLRVLKKYVSYLNQNIPSDSTNTLSQKVLDSMLVASRTVLNKVKLETEQKNRLLDIEEKKLLDNELSISNKLQTILTEIESEIMVNTAKNNEAKTIALNKIIRIVTWAAVIGLVLALFFLLLILNDFLKTKKYKHQLEWANNRTKALLKSREQLISTVSHDLKTPLSTISGYSELINNTDPPKKLKYYNNNIKGASEYIAHLVQDLLDFTQLEAGKVTVDNIPFQLPEIIGEIATTLQSVNSDKPINLSIEVESSLNRRIIGDPFRLRQILTNLIGNAYKFTSEGSINIIAKQLPDINMLSIRIEDTGIGIAAEKQSLIFDEFTQADETVEKRFGGTGLGLTISKKMAEILGGTLTVESAFGKGSAFTLTLPLLYDSTENVGAPTQLLSIAVVDDDSNLLNLTSEILRQLGHRTYTYSNASDALADLSKSDIDLIFTDIQMPGIDGFEFVEKLQTAEWFQQKKIPVIAVTGKADANENLYSKAGFEMVIRKPYTLQNINDCLTRLNDPDAPPPQLPTTTSSSIGLRAFFPDDPAGMHLVLKAFYANARLDIRMIDEAIQLNQIEKVREIAHRICPMYQQLGAKNIGTTLCEMESEFLSQQDLSKMYNKLIPEVDILLAEIERELVLQSV